MYLQRKIDSILEDWKRNENRKPIIIKGSRQVGKTESIRHFANKHYKSVIEINFVEEPKYQMITADGYGTAEIIKNIPVNIIYNEEAFVVENVPEGVPKHQK